MADHAHEKAQATVPDAIRAAAIEAGLTDTGATWAGLSGGRSNHIWKIGKAPDAVICKLFVPDASSILFPNDPAAEIKALTALAGTGLAPHFLAVIETAHGDCLFYRHVAGQPGGQQPFTAGRTLRALHASQPADGLRHVPCTEHGIMDQAMDMLAGLPIGLHDRLMAARPAPQDQSLAEPAPVFLHGDPVPNNFIAGRSTVLIDWQCPARGHPVHDLAIYLSPAMQSLYGHGPLSERDRAAFLHGYGTPDAPRWLAHLGPACAWRIAVHCAWRAARDDTGYADAMALELARL